MLLVPCLLLATLRVVSYRAFDVTTSASGRSVCARLPVPTLSAIWLALVQDWRAVQLTMQREHHDFVARP
jgi:hypothetical protein